MTTFAHHVAPRRVVLPSLTAAEIMAPDLLALEKRMPIQKAFALLRFNELESAPVVDEHGGLAGVITSANCAAWEEFSRRSLSLGVIRKDLDLAPESEISSSAVERNHQDGPASEGVDALVNGVRDGFTSSIATARSSVL